MHASQLCLGAARSAIGILHTNLASGSRLLSCIAMHVSLSAAAVIIACSVIDELQVSIDHGEDETALKMVFAILEAHANSMQGTTRASEQLRKFMNMVEKWKTRQPSQSNTSTCQRVSSFVEAGIGKPPTCISHMVIPLIVHNR
jgi:hypothetical protein